MTARPLLTVTVPTIGRPTLARTLDSLLSQPDADRLEVLVIGDSHGHDLEPARAICAERPGVCYSELDAGRNAWGHPQRQHALSLATGRYLAALDDDDVWAAGAFAAIRHGIAKEPKRPLIFRMRYASGRTLWAQPSLQEGNVGSPMVVVPNDPERLGQWTDRYEGDFDFARSTCAFYPEGPAWRDEVIALIRPPEAR